MKIGDLPEGLLERLEGEGNSPSDIVNQLIRNALQKGMRPPFEMRWDGPFCYLVEARRFVDLPESQPA